MDKKAQLMRHLGADSNEMTSKDEVMRIFKQHGISDQDAKQAFEKVDIDNDDEMPRSVVNKVVDALGGKMY